MEQQKEKATASITDAIAQTVSDYFDQPNAKDTVYSTSDGNVFENLGFATDHGSKLVDKNVTPHTNPKSIEVIEEEDLTDDPIVLDPEQTELLNSGLVKENYQKLKQLASFLKLEIENQQADTIIKALEDYKATINK